MIIKKSGFQKRSSVERPIYKGDFFKKYFKNNAKVDFLIKKDGNVEDTVKAMEHITVLYGEQALPISKLLKVKDRNGKVDIKRTAENVFNFIQKYLKYKIERGEELRSPNASFYYGQIAYFNDPSNPKNGIDCDCMSIFAGCIFRNLKIPFAFRIADYGNGFQHVYTIVYEGDKEIVCDPVWHYFNTEKKYVKIKTFNKMQGLSGVDIHFLGSLGKAKKKKKRKGKFKKFLVKVGSKLKKISPTLALSRGAFLVVLAVNFRGLATRLALDEVARKKFIKFWEKAGGNTKKLLDKIEKAKKRKAIFGKSKSLKKIEKLNKEKGKLNGLTDDDILLYELQGIFEGINDYDTLGVEPVTIATSATATAAAPIVTTALKFLKQSGITEKLGEKLKQKALDSGKSILNKGLNKMLDKQRISKENNSQFVSENGEIGEVGEFGELSGKKRQARKQKRKAKKENRKEKRKLKKAARRQKRKDKKELGRKAAREKFKQQKKEIKKNFKEKKKQIKQDFKKNKKMKTPAEINNEPLEDDSVNNNPTTPEIDNNDNLDVDTNDKESKVEEQEDNQDLKIEEDYEDDSDEGLEDDYEEEEDYEDDSDEDLEDEDEEDYEDDSDEDLEDEDEEDYEDDSDEDFEDEEDYEDDSDEDLEDDYDEEDYEDDSDEDLEDEYEEKYSKKQHLIRRQLAQKIKKLIDEGKIKEARNLARALKKQEVRTELWGDLGKTKAEKKAERKAKRAEKRANGGGLINKVKNLVNKVKGKVQPQTSTNTTQKETQEINLQEEKMTSKNDKKKGSSVPLVVAGVVGAAAVLGVGSYLIFKNKDKKK